MMIYYYGMLFEPSAVLPSAHGRPFWIFMSRVSQSVIPRTSNAVKGQTLPHVRSAGNSKMDTNSKIQCRNISKLGDDDSSTCTLYPPFVFYGKDKIPQVPVVKGQVIF
jgi:hypothetical protein